MSGFFSPEILTINMHTFNFFPSVYQYYIIYFMPFFEYEFKWIPIIWVDLHVQFFLLFLFAVIRLIYIFTILALNAIFTHKHTSCVLIKKGYSIDFISYLMLFHLAFKIELIWNEMWMMSKLMAADMFNECKNTSKLNEKNCVRVWVSTHHGSHLAIAISKPIG